MSTARAYGRLAGVLLWSAFSHCLVVLTIPLRRLAPAVSDAEVQRWGRSIRRALCAALLDKRISPDEFRDELRILVDGYVRQDLGHVDVARPL